MARIECNQLLGCPFCGKSPEIHKHFREDAWQLIHRCKVMGPLCIEWQESLEQLIKRWNTRTNETSDGTN